MKRTRKQSTAARKSLAASKVKGHEAEVKRRWEQKGWMMTPIKTIR